MTERIRARYEAWFCELPGVECLGERDGVFHIKVHGTSLALPCTLLSREAQLARVESIVRMAWGLP